MRKDSPPKAISGALNVRNTIPKGGFQHEIKVLLMRVGMLLAKLENAAIILLDLSDQRTFRRNGTRSSDGPSFIHQFSMEGSLALYDLVSKDWGPYGFGYSDRRFGIWNTAG